MALDNWFIRSKCRNSGAKGNQCSSCASRGRSSRQWRAHSWRSNLTIPFQTLVDPPARLRACCTCYSNRLGSARQHPSQKISREIPFGTVSCLLPSSRSPWAALFPAICLRSARLGCDCSPWVAADLGVCPLSVAERLGGRIRGSFAHRRVQDGAMTLPSPVCFCLLRTRDQKATRKTRVMTAPP